MWRWTIIKLKPIELNNHRIDLCAVEADAMFGVILSDKQIINPRKQNYINNYIKLLDAIYRRVVFRPWQ